MTPRTCRSAPSRPAAQDASTGHTKFSWGTIQQRQKMADHCRKISQQSESMAQGYDALAKLHDEQSKSAP